MGLSNKTKKTRLDQLLVERGLAESREKAQALIIAGAVSTSSGRLSKPGTFIRQDVEISVKSGLPYVSRGGIKLAHALDRFNIDVKGLTILDVGASTGGFTDCLLKRGSREVYALDVGYGQLDFRLRRDPRVVVLEKINARYPFHLPLTHEDTEQSDSVTVDMATIDVSFISSTKVIPTVVNHIRPGGAILLLLKPQFEALRGEVGRGGAIMDPRIHIRVISRMIKWITDEQLRLRNLTASPIVGNAKNQEFFLLLNK